ncbi:MAG: IPT/TIG domain-containing protein [Bacteroidota bacterium]
MRTIFPAVILSFVVVSGCTEEPAVSIYDPNAPTAAAPVITAISVEGGGGLLSGISTIVIDGQNFSTDSSKVIVFFDAVRATLLSTSMTQIKVKAPTMVKDSVKVRVSILGAEDFSPIRYVDLKPAVSLFGNFTSFEEAYGIAADQAGNIYAGMLSSGLGIGLRKYTPAGDTSTYSQRGGIDYLYGLKVGPGGVIYASRNSRVMYTIVQGGVPVPWVQRSGAIFYDLDFDKNMNIWTGGADSSVYRIKQDKTITPFSFLPNANVRSVRVYNDYLYLGGKVDSIEGVWRAPIDGSGNIGTFTKYFDLSAQPGYSPNGAGVYAITFNTDGEMYVGTNGPDGILLVAPNASAVQKYYPGLFVPNAINFMFAWGDGSNLYVTRRGNSVTTNILLKINTQKQSAPYYGRGDL